MTCRSAALTVPGPDRNARGPGAASPLVTARDCGRDTNGRRIRFGAVDPSGVLIWLARPPELRACGPVCARDGPGRLTWTGGRWQAAMPTGLAGEARPPALRPSG